MKKRIIVILLILCTGMMCGAATVKRKMTIKINQIQRLSDKHFALFFIMTQWVKAKQSGKSLGEYFNKNGYYNIAVYGMGYVGETLLNELKNTNIRISYGIDKNAGNISSDICLLNTNEVLPEVDAIIVTSIFFFDEIKDELEKIVNCPIISLEDIIIEIT